MPALPSTPPETADCPLPGRLQRPAAAGLNLNFDRGDGVEHPRSVQQRHLVQQLSDSSPVTPSDLHPSPSPYGAVAHSPLSTASTGSTLDSAPPTPSENEDSWNLIPYNVPWGSEYHQYDAGTLPGPEGACIFLRSPTPLKNQRTTQACEKCRERKAKCSGDRPSCARCLARGHTCTYVSDPDKRVRGASLNRRKRRETVCTAYSTPDLSDAESRAQSRRNSEPDIAQPHDPSRGVKREPSADACGPAVVPDHPAPAGQEQEQEQWAGYGYQDAPCLSTGAFSRPAEYGVPPLYPEEPQQYTEQPTVEYHFPSSAAQQSIYAPRPVRHAASMPFLPPPPTAQQEYYAEPTMQMSMSISPAMESYPQQPPGVDSPLLTSPVHPYTLAALEQQHAVYYPPAEYGAPGEMEMYCGPPPAGYEQSPISLYGDAGAYHGQPPSYHPNDNMPSFAQAYLAS